MQSLAQIRALLAERGLRPKKSLGQNFLLDHNLITKLVDVSGASAGDVVLEVGPGTGALTHELLERGCRVIAIELDDALADMLTESIGAGPHAERFSLVRGDCLASKRALNRDAAAMLGERPFRLVANLPYHAATPLMLTLLADHAACSGLHVTIQREVADRFAASSGDPAYGSVSIVAACVAECERIAVLPPACFWPRPGVDSAMIALRRREIPFTDDARHLAEFCQTMFASRRKQIGPVLKKQGLSPAAWPDGAEPTMRIEQLSPRLVAALAKAARPRPA
ncbi:MAG: 16S rRNA (adenine(1518)-N(6)/adenine(1519)-N(6))-dimethyltransferase RsmA [Planctomycetota bacterium]